MAEKNEERKSIFKGPWLYLLIAPVVVFLGISMLLSSGNKEISTQRGLEILKSDNVKSVKLIDGDQRVNLELKSPDEKTATSEVHFFYVHQRGDEIIKAVNNAHIEKEFNDENPQPNPIMSFLEFIFPVVIMGGLILWMMNSMGGAGGKIMQFAKARGKVGSKEMPTVRFADVAGADEAVEELQEIRDFLEKPERYQRLGAKIPKGVLLYGPPGTGKTLLAKAVAGEAGVPFFSMSGSDFVEMFVGVGASRVRDLFKEAKANAPAIIFVDEIDAVGQRRGNGMGGGHDEREQTLNQLLVEMDGFDDKTNVLMIAATNRADMLDPALLRPGRFDRQIGVDAPDMAGRKKILEVHSKDKPLSKSVDLDSVARKTPGYTGADLANVLNEAALLTARSNADLIDNRALDEAIDRVMAGPQRRTRIMKDKEKLMTAYHEGGHALVAAGLNHSAPVTKITILPRGRALGYTMVVPLEDKYSVTRNELQDQLAYALGGRVAEEIIFHDPTTGAGNDIEKATATARKMVTDYGMSADLGPIKLSSSDRGGPLGDLASREHSEKVQEIIDQEVRELIEIAHNEAYQILNMNRDILDNLARELMEKETLDHKRIDEIFKDVKKLPERQIWLSSDQRPVSDLPPIEIAAQSVSENASEQSVQVPQTTVPESPVNTPASPTSAAPEKLGETGSAGSQPPHNL